MEQTLQLNSSYLFVNQLFSTLNVQKILLSSPIIPPDLYKIYSKFKYESVTKKFAIWKWDYKTPVNQVKRMTPKAYLLSNRV